MQRQINSTDFVRALVDQNTQRPANVYYQGTCYDSLDNNVFSLRNSLEILQGTLKEIERLSEIVRSEINFIEEVVDELESVM